MTKLKKEATIWLRTKLSFGNVDPVLLHFFHKTQKIKISSGLSHYLNTANQHKLF